jgi:hypothetical protein
MRTKRTEYTVSDFLTWKKAETLDLNPSFQRRSVWRPGAKSLLIDSLLRGMPVPVIFLREQPANLRTLEPRRAVVDGQQRLRTVISYIAPQLLDGFNKSKDGFALLPAHNAEFADATFDNLPPDAQQRLLDYPFAVHVFPADADDREILKIFARLNATGVRLNQQELRNAEFYGYFKTYSYNLAYEQLDRWRTWRIFTDNNISRMAEVELTSELLIVIMDGIKGKNASVLRHYYTKFDAKWPERDAVAARFRATMDLMNTAIPSKSWMYFRSKTLFYCLFAAVHRLAFPKELSSTKARKSVPEDSFSKLLERGKNIYLGKAPKAVLEAKTRRTSHLSSRQSIFDYLQE